MNVNTYYLKAFAWNSTRRLVAVLHVANIAQQLELVIHGGDNGIKTISDQTDLFVKLSIGRQRVDGNACEFEEMFLGTRSLLEKP